MKKIKDYYKNSYVCKIQKYIKKITKESFLLRKLKEDKKENITEESKTIKIFENVLNIPFFLPVKVKSKAKEVLEASLLGKVIECIYMKIHIVLGCVLILFLNIPHRFWNNWYGVIIISFLYILYVVWKNVVKDERVKLKHIDFSIYLFYGFVVLSVITSVNIQESIKTFSFYLTAFLMIIMIINGLSSERKLNTFINLLIVGVFFSGLYGIYQWKIIGVGVDLAYTDMANNEGLPGRVFSTMGNPNNYAEILILLLPLFAYKFLHTKKIVNKIVIALVASPVVLILILTSSRSAWGAIFIAFMLFIAIRYPKILPILILVGILCVPFIPDWIINRAITVFKGSDGSIGYRGLIYETTWPMLKDFWFTGVGFGSGTYRSIIKGYPIVTKAVPVHTHNVYLQMWIELGLVGGLSFVYMFMRTIKRAGIAAGKALDNAKKDLLIIFAVTVIGIMVMGTVEYVLFYQRVMYIMFLIIALTYATINVSKQKSL